MLVRRLAGRGSQERGFRHLSKWNRSWSTLEIMQLQTTSWFWIGWHYLSNATRLIRPHLFSTALLVSYGELKVLHDSSVLKNMRVGQVALDKWLPLSTGGGSPSCPLPLGTRARQKPARAPGPRGVLHSCHILPFQPILWNKYFPSELANTAKHSPKFISEGGRLWQVCPWLRTNGVSTDGVAAKVIIWQIAEKGTHNRQTLIDVDRLVPKRYLCQKTTQTRDLQRPHQCCHHLSLSEVRRRVRRLLVSCCRSSAGPRRG